MLNTEKWTTEGDIPRRKKVSTRQFGGSGVPPGGQKFAGLVAGSER
jgi:hypothetical protein